MIEMFVAIGNILFSHVWNFSVEKMQHFVFSLKSLWQRDAAMYCNNKKIKAEDGYTVC